MSTIPRQLRTGAERKLPFGLMCGLAFSTWAIAPVLAQDATDAEPPPTASSAAEVPPTASSKNGADDIRSFDTVKITSLKMNLDLTERYSKDLEFNELVRLIYDYDDKIISVTPLTPNRVKIRGISQGVTTIVAVGASNQKYLIEVCVGGDARLLQSVLKSAFPGSNVECRALVSGAILLTGFVTDNQTINQIMEVAREYAPNVINQMRVGGPQEVQTRVKVLEVQRSRLRTLGVNLQALTQSAVISSAPGSITPITSLINPIAGQPSSGMQPTSTNPLSLAAGFNNDNFALNIFLQALKEEGLLKVMSEPVLVARSGEAAQLADGGEFPIPVPGGLGTVTIEFREFGVILQALPLVISPTRVKMQVSAEVSDKDVANSITLQGTTVPGITKRKLQSTVDMNFGDTMVVGGLISTRETGTQFKTTWIGELPIIGTLFSKKVSQQSEIELIILLTPEYGSSIPSDQIPPGGPGLFTTTPTDKEMYFHGLIEVPRFGPDCPDGDCPNQYHMNGTNGMNGTNCNTPNSPTPVVVPNSTVKPEMMQGPSGLIAPQEGGHTTPPPPAPNADNSVSKRTMNGMNPSSKSRTTKSREADASSSRTVSPAGYKKSNSSGPASDSKKTDKKPTDKKPTDKKTAEKKSEEKATSNKKNDDW